VRESERGIEIAPNQQDLGAFYANAIRHLL